MKIYQYVNHNVPTIGCKNEQLLFLSEEGCRCAKACKNQGWRWGISLNPELAVWTRLTTQWAPRICLPPLPSSGVTDAHLHTWCLHGFWSSKRSGYEVDLYPANAMEINWCEWCLKENGQEWLGGRVNKQATSAVTWPVFVGIAIPLSSEIKMLLKIKCSIACGNTV